MNDTAEKTGSTSSADLPSATSARVVGSWIAEASPGWELQGEFVAQAKLIRALGKARAAFAPVLADATGQIQNRSFKYMDLSAIYAEAIPKLDAEELTLLHLLTDDCRPGYKRLTLMLAGHDAILTGWVTFKSETGGANWENDKQGGGTTSYWTRYQLRALLCLAGDDDPDAAPQRGPGGAQGRSTPPLPTPKGPQQQTRPQGTQEGPKDKPKEPPKEGPKDAPKERRPEARPPVRPVVAGPAVGRPAPSEPAPSPAEAKPGASTPKMSDNTFSAIERVINGASLPAPEVDRIIFAEFNQAQDDFWNEANEDQAQRALTLLRDFAASRRS